MRIYSGSRRKERSGGDGDGWERGPYWIEVVSHYEKDAYPWNIENAPVIIKTKDKIIPEWTIYNEMAGPLSYSLSQRHMEDKPADAGSIRLLCFENY